MRRLAYGLLAFATLTSVAIAGESTTRFWTDNTGEFTVKASIHRLDDDFVTLHLQNGSDVCVEIRRLSSEDQAWLRQNGSAFKLQKERVAGIDWYSELHDAKTIALEQNKPIMCFRALGKLSGFM